MEFAAYLKTFLGLLAIVDPFVAVPMFLALTPDLSANDRHRIARIAAITVFAVLMCAMLMGSPLLAFLGVSLAAFKVAGAILLFMNAISSFNAEPGRVRQTPEEEAEAHDKLAIWVVPIGMPLLAGPGAISMVIVYAGAHQSTRLTDIAHLASMSVVISLVALITWFCLRAAQRVAARLGRTGMNVATRVGGLITMALAVEIFSAGLSGLFPGLKT